MKHKIKNLTNSPYALAAVGGAVIVPARGEVVAEFDAHQIYAVKIVGYFKVDEVKSDAEKARDSDFNGIVAGLSEAVTTAAPKRGRPRKES